jgi:hypothetical protein
MTLPSGATDILTLNFYNPLTGGNVGGFSVGASGQPNQQGFALTEFCLEKDFFTPSNSFTMTVSQIGSQLTGANSITSWMQNGLGVIVLINGATQMNGYVFQYQLHISRQGGTSLVIHVKDLLELMAQGSCFPNMGTSRTTNVHFPPTTTLGVALSTIAQSFLSVNNLPFDIDIQADDTESKSNALAGKLGLKVQGKTPTSRQKSLNTALNRFSTPEKGESYLRYMLRLAKHAGANLRMSDDQPNTITCKPPTYDRDTVTPFQITHLLSAPFGSTNVERASYYFDLNEQYSCAIIEANTTAPSGNFYQQTFKAVALNELTAYPPGAGNPSNAVAQIQALNGSGNSQGIGNALQTLTNQQLTGTATSGYSIAPFNQQLYQVGQSLPVKNIGLSLPYYSVDKNAHTAGSGGEVDFAASKVLSEKQDKYCLFTYELTGWTMTGTQFIWQPDVLVSITEEAFNPGNPQQITMWIRKVKFTKSRGGGTRTELVCSLPYTHNFDMSD